MSIESMKKEMTLQEWKKVGEKAKGIQRGLMDLAGMLENKLPKTTYSNKLRSAKKAFGELRSHLDDMVCGKFLDMPNREITHIFYGKKEEK